jgi:hypothetical protein
MGELKSSLLSISRCRLRYEVNLAVSEFSNSMGYTELSTVFDVPE